MKSCEHVNGEEGDLKAKLNIFKLISIRLDVE